MLQQRLSFSGHFCVFCLTLVVAACGGGGGQQGNPPAPPVNRAPTAIAGGGVSVQIGTAAYSLDASASSDPEGGPLTFSWILDSQPGAASAMLTGADSATPEFSSMVPGDYTFTVTVTDNAGNSASATATVTLVNDAPVISADFDPNPAIGDAVAFDASATVDPNGHPLTFAWTIIDGPDDSGAPLDYAGEVSMLTFDAPGQYTLRLTVSDGYDDAVATWDNIDASAFRTATLTEYFTDAEIDSARNRIVSLLSDKLNIIDVATANVTTIDLPLVGAAVSVAPDGNSAVVGHDGWVSHVDLAIGTVINTWPVAAVTGDVVLDSNAYAYVFPQTGQWTNVLVLDLTDGSAAPSTGGSVRHRSRAKLHPDGDAIYLADNGISPSDVERISIGSGSASVEYDSPYHGDFPFCGDLWIDDSGDTMLTRCRVIVRTTDDPNTDLTFVRQLDNETRTIRHASSSAFADTWLVIDGDQNSGSSSVKIYDHGSGNLLREEDMPYIDDSQTNRWIARYVFADEASEAYYVLAVDDDQSFLRYALLERLDPSPSGLNFKPEAVAPRFLTHRTGESVILDGSASTDPENQPLAFTWTLVNQPIGSTLDPDGGNATVAFVPTIAGTYEFELVVNDGVRSSNPIDISVNVFDPGSDLVHRLPGNVDDIEFSKSLNALVYLSSLDDDLHILDVSDFSETTIALPQQAFRVGIAPDGLRAAVSHSGMASLIDLVQAEILDTQSYTAQWGDIVLDRNDRAHLVPVRDQWVEFYTLDFATDSVSELFGARADTQLRMHPVFDWIYGADVGLSPSDIEKWDASTFPTLRRGDSPYHGDFPFSGNIWISEDGERLFAASGNTFRSSADALLDMTYAGSVSESVFAIWADHSQERGEWAVATNIWTNTPDLREKIVYFEDVFSGLLRSESSAPVPTHLRENPSTPRFVFFNDDGSRVIAVIEALDLDDPVAVQIITP